MEYQEWAKWPWTRCRAVKEPSQYGGYHGRCDLKYYHEGDHKLDRGLDQPQWSTEWTA